ncbi:MAG: ABC transporter permease [Betaproteobacteria bacterium]|nr:ABC transporter permease [Betaproteobacteria bacterium]MDE2359278.1 ABC transporter permease [Betaproteobacteria bacterium]
MAIPLGYIARNVLARRLTTALTAGGMALVVYVFASVLMLAAGLRQTLVSTGQDDNVVVIRRGSQTEVQSGIDRSQAGIIESLPDIAVAADGRRLISKEPVVLISLPKRSTGKPANVVIRGITAAGLDLRPQVRLVEGRMFRPGTSEVIVGRSIATGFSGTDLDETLRFASRDWIIVGVFDAGHTGFDSEIWGDAEQMLQAFRRTAFSSVIFKLADPGRFDAVKATLETDPRLTLEVKREKQFYAEQSEALSRFISTLGTGISIIFSIGAVIGAAITMYASVASRTGEIGTLRALGFSRRAILLAFLVEALLLGLIGGIAGLAGASAMQALTISTTNFQTFAEIAFSFTLTPGIVAASLAFALTMGFIGGFLPALRAARMKIVDALRAA